MHNTRKGCIFESSLTIKNKEMYNPIIIDQLNKDLEIVKSWGFTDDEIEVSKSNTNYGTSAYIYIYSSRGKAFGGKHKYRISDHGLGWGRASVEHEDLNSLHRAIFPEQWKEVEYTELGFVNTIEVPEHDIVKYDNVKVIGSRTAKTGREIFTIQYQPVRTVKRMERV